MPQGQLGFQIFVSRSYCSNNCSSNSFRVRCRRKLRRRYARKLKAA